MPRESSAAPVAVRSPRPPPAEPPNQPEPSPADESDGYDSDSEDWLDFLEESTHDGLYFALPGYVGDDTRILQPQRLRCVACNRPILVPTLDIGHHPILWRLAHCRHPFHLRCLYPVEQSQHPHRFDNPSDTRLRRRNRELPFDHRPISRFEDADRIKTWPCPKDGCGQTQFSVRFRNVWYPNVHGMTMDGHFIRGPTHL